MRLKDSKIQNKLNLAGWGKKIKFSMFYFSPQLYTGTGEPEYWFSKPEKCTNEHHTEMHTISLSPWKQRYSVSDNFGLNKLLFSLVV
jgi:hypothetical protein